VKGAACLSVAVAALASGCVHLRLRDGAGDVDLGRPPPALAARGATLPRPPWDRALVVSPGVLVGAGVRSAEGVVTRERGVGFELGLYATRIRLDEMMLDGERLDYGFGPVFQAWGVNLGWNPPATRSSVESHQPSAYIEAQWRRELAGLAAGVAFTPEDARRVRTALQITPLLGPAYARVQLLLDGNVAFEVGIAIKLPVLISWGS
jgi:hypothetical protein